MFIEYPVHTRRIRADVGGEGLDADEFMRLDGG